MQTLAGKLLQPNSPSHCEVISNSIIRIGGDGRFAEVGVGKSKAKDVIGGPDFWIMPGFVDAHLHVPQWDRRGIDGLSPHDWLEKVVYPAEARFKDADFAEKLAEQFVTASIANGTTLVSAFGSPFSEAVDRVFEVFAKRGLRAVYGKMLNDTNCPGYLSEPADQALNESRELAAKWHGADDGRLSYAFSPRTPACCSEKLMRGAATLAGMFNCFVQTHVSESPLESAAVHDAFPDCLDDVDILAEMGLLTGRTILGHGVFLNQQQRSQVAESGTAVVHCPTANLFLASGLMDYVAHRAAGIRVALGSSIAGGYEPFMPQVAVQCLQTAKAVKVHAVPRGAYLTPSPAEAWWALTRGGAEAFGMANRFGAIAPGFEADCLVVRPEPWIADLPEDQQISALLYTMSPSQIKHVFIAGRRVGP